MVGGVAFEDQLTVGARVILVSQEALALWEHSDHQEKAPELRVYPLVVSTRHSDWSTGRSSHSAV